jgi:Family of unknown function (DUF6188)
VILLQRSNGGFLGKFDDAEVIQVLLDFRFALSIQDGDQAEKLDVAIATTFSARSTPDGRAAQYDPEASDPALGALAVAVRFQRVTECRVTSEGLLRLGFASDLQLEVPPSPDYEAWQLDSSDLKIIAKPGGGLAVWDETSSADGDRQDEASSAEAKMNVEGISRTRDSI